MYIHIYTYKYIYVYVYIYMYMNIYIHIHTWINIRGQTHFYMYVCLNQICIATHCNTHFNTCNTHSHITRYNTLQHTIKRVCMNWQCITIHCTLQHTATHCNTLQHTIKRVCMNRHCHTATHCNTLQHTATHYKTCMYEPKVSCRVLPPDECVGVFALEAFVKPECTHTSTSIYMYMCIYTYVNICIHTCVYRRMCGRVCAW